MKPSRASRGTILKRHHRRVRSNLSLKEFARRIDEFTVADGPGNFTRRCATIWLKQKGLAA